MNIKIKTTNMPTSQALSEYVQKRLSKITKLLGNDSSIQCDVELARTTSHHQKGDIFRAEVHIVGSGKNIYSSAERSDAYVAVDEVRDELLRELKSTKEKKISFVRRGGAQIKNMIRGVWPFRRKRNE